MLVAPNTKLPNTKPTSKTEENMLPGKEARDGIVTGSYAGCLASVFVASLVPNTWEIAVHTYSEQVSKTSGGACVGTATREIFLWHVLSLYIQSKNK